LEVIELLAAEAGWMRLSDVAQRLDLNGPTHGCFYLSEHGW
jgi:DNA-binding IclR family transcriptional regulator